MKDNELQFERGCHVLYSGPCKKEIRARIAQHYPEAEREAVWERVQRQYVYLLALDIGKIALQIDCSVSNVYRKRRHLSNKLEGLKG